MYPIVMPSVGVSIDGTVLRKQFDRSQARLDALINAALHRTVELAVMYARLSRLYRSHTYGLRASIGGFVINGMGGTTGVLPTARVEAKAPYAGLVEYGTPPHEIHPRRKQVLRFVSNGEVRFARSVFHPGTSPRPFMQEAQQAVAPLFEDLVTKAIQESFR